MSSGLSKILLVAVFGLFAGIVSVKILPYLASAVSAPSGVLFADEEVKGDAELSPHLIGWRALLPDQDQEAWLDLKEKQAQAAESSDLDPMAEQVLQALVAANDKPYQASMQSTATTSSFLGKNIQIPGFIVPLEVSDERQVLSFFLVPYFGACLHYPPPPPNQMIYVQLSAGMPMPSIYEPYLIEGVLHAEMFEDPLGTSAYFLEPSRISGYDQEPDDFRTH